jgi:hypothetical protein
MHDLALFIIQMHDLALFIIQMHDLALFIKTNKTKELINSKISEELD